MSGVVCLAVGFAIMVVVHGPKFIFQISRTTFGIVPGSRLSGLNGDQSYMHDRMCCKGAAHLDS